MSFTGSSNAQSRNINSTEAAPSNDNFAGAVPMVLAEGVAEITTNNIDSTKEPGEPNHAENAGGRSVWFSFTPAATTAVRINVVDTTFDTLLAVYQGTNVNNLTLVGYNDDCTSLCGASTVDLMVIAGQTYYIAVDGFNDFGNVGSGSFKIVILNTTTPDQDNFASAYNLGTSHSSSIAGTNYNATREANEPVHYINNPNGKSVWYKWKATANFSVTFELTETSGFDSQMAVYKSNVNLPTISQLIQVDSSPDYVGYTDSRYRVTFFAESGKTYYIAIDWHTFANDVSAGNFQLRFRPNKLRYSTKLSGFGERASISIYRPTESNWYNLINLNSPNPYIFHWGLEGDTPMPADYNGDGISQLAVVRNENGKRVWYIGNGGALFQAIQWGLSTDKIASGDFDGDGCADLVAIRNTAQGFVWYIRKSSNGGLMTFGFGTTGDKPVLGDFDGDGYTDVAVIRNTQNGIVWHILKSGFASGQPMYSQYSATQFGVAPDVATAEDFDGDGKTDIAVWRPSTGTWYILRSSDNQFEYKNFGLTGDKPQPADYDGDGKADVAVFRPSTGLWYIIKSGNDQWTVLSWGVSTDVPASSMSMLMQ